MKPQNLKQSLFKNWKSCRDAICNAISKIFHTTKMLLRYRKRAGQLLCAFMAVMGVTGSVLDREADAYSGYVATLNGIEVIDTISKTITDLIYMGHLSTGRQSLVMTPNGKQIYVSPLCEFEGACYVTAVDSVTETVTKLIKLNYPSSLYLTPDGKYVYFGNLDYHQIGGLYTNKLYVMETATNKIVDTITFPFGVTDISFTPNGKQAYLIHRDDNTKISILNVNSKKIKKTFKLQWKEINPQDPNGEKITIVWSSDQLHVTPDGTRAYIFGRGYILPGQTANDRVIGIVLNLATNTIVTKLRGQNNVANSVEGVFRGLMLFSSDGKYGYANSCDNSNIFFFDTINNTLIKTMYLAFAPLGMAFSPDKKSLYVTHHAKVSEIEVATGTVVSVIYDIRLSYSGGIAIAPDLSTPIIVIPGISGSLSSCLFVDPDSGEACPPSKEFDYIVSHIDLTPAWVLEPIEKTYAALVQELRNTGAPVYEVPYDWRQPNQKTAKTTLLNIVNQAKRETGSDKVDIVAHSMGGLVARSYIELLGKKDIRKFVMLGTPNRGSCNAYYSWEGGDFSMQGFWTNNLFYVPLIKAMKAGYHLEDMADHEFVRYAVPALQQLLPADDFLYKENKKSIPVRIPIAKMVWKNNLIPKLKDSKLIESLGVSNIQIFAGNTDDLTIASIFVKPTGGASLYPDGEPVRTFEALLGDGTVTMVSAQSSLGLSGVNVRWEDAIHTDLPDRCRANVVRFLAGEPLQEASVSSENPAPRTQAAQQSAIESQLSIATSSNIRMGLATAEGQRLGNFPLQEGKIAEVGRYFYLGDKNQTTALGIENPPSGEYSLTLSTGELSADYKILIAFTNQGGKNIEQIVKGTVTRDDVQTLRFNVNSGLELR